MEELPVLLGEQGCRAVWTLFLCLHWSSHGGGWARQLHQQRQVWVKQGIALGGGHCSTSLKMSWCYLWGTGPGNHDGSLGRMGILVPPGPSTTGWVILFSSLFPASLDIPHCRSTLCDSRGLRSKFEGKCVYIVWGCVFFTLSWLTVFILFQGQTSFRGHWIWDLHPILWWLCLVLTTQLEESIMKTWLDWGSCFSHRGFFWSEEMPLLNAEKGGIREM